MELTQLRYFYQTYRSGGIRKAAGELNITQQAVSKQIRNLEDELDVCLFYRNQSGVTPTEYAHMLAEKVKRILPELDDFAYSLQHRGEIVSGVVRLGVQCWQMAEGSSLNYDVLKKFMTDYPQIQLTWENASPGHCVQAVLDDGLDLCVASMPERTQGLELTPLRTVQSYILMAKDHPLSVREALTCEDLAGQLVMIAEEEKGVRINLRQALFDKEPPILLDVKDSLFDLLGQKILGDHALMLTSEAQKGLFHEDRFVMLPLHWKTAQNQLYLIRRENHPASPAADVLYQYLIEHWSGGDNFSLYGNTEKNCFS